MKVTVPVSETTVVCSTVESAGAPPVLVRVMVVRAGTIEVVTVTSFVDVLSSVFVTGFGGWYAGQKPLQKPYPLWFLSSFAIRS